MLEHYKTYLFFFILKAIEKIMFSNSKGKLLNVQDWPRKNIWSKYLPRHDQPFIFYLFIDLDLPYITQVSLFLAFCG